MPKIRPRVSLEVGRVTVWLGVPKQEVLKDLASAGYKKIRAGANLAMFKFGSEIYSVGFKAERLTYPERSGEFPQP